MWVPANLPRNGLMRNEVASERLICSRLDKVMAKNIFYAGRFGLVLSWWRCSVSVFASANTYLDSPTGP